MSLPRPHVVQASKQPNQETRRAASQPAASAFPRTIDRIVSSLHTTLSARFVTERCAPRAAAGATHGGDESWLLRKAKTSTPAELELYLRERCELQNKRVAEPERARRRQRGNPAPRAMARQRSDKLRAVPLERREEAEWPFGSHAALSDAADAWRETARDRATPPKPGVETPPAAQTRCAPSDAACAAARELAVQRQLRVQRDRVRAPLFAHALAQASAARVAAQAHMHMHLHLTCTCTCTGTCTYSPTCTCPVHNAQALGLEVNKLYRELNGLIGCSFNPLPDYELPRQPWDTQG